MSDAAKLFRQEAAILIRDLKAGTVKPSEVDEYIRAAWDKDEDEYADAYGVRSFSAFRTGIKALLDKRPGGKKKAAVKKSPAKKKALKRTIVRHESLLAKLKRRWRLL